MKARTGAAVVRLICATALLHLVLIQPNHPAALGWGTLTVFPLELPVIVLALLALGRGTWGRAFRVALVAVLGVLAVLKTADFAMFNALSRGFNPVADVPLIEAGVRLLAGAIGGVAAFLAVGASIGAVALVIALLWWATGVWARAAPSAARWRRVAGGCATACAMFVAGEVGHTMGQWKLPLDPPGTAFTARLGVERAQTVRATLADLSRFQALADADPFAGQDGLLDRIDRDVIIVFVESYGRTSLDTPLFSDLHRATLAKGEAELRERGLSMASGVLASPTRGGQSWLAHATFANGLWVDNQTSYRAALASGRQTLFHIAQRSGFQTAAVMPQITLDWPEAALMGFDTILAARDLGYQGAPFNWVTMPDQFTFAALDRLLRDKTPRKPLFVQLATGTSHAPWVPVPRLIPWEEIGDGTEFNEMAAEGDPPDVVWRDRDRVRAQYRLAVDYALQTVLSYAARHSDDPPLMIVLGDHQAAGFVALDERPDVPIHVIGPAALVEQALAIGFNPGLIPSSTAPVRPMTDMRDLFLNAFSSAPGPRAEVAQ